MFNKIREIARWYKLLSQYDEIKKEIEVNGTKHVLLSKTFWLNVAGLAVTFSGVLPLQYAAPVLAIANIGIRLMTNQTITFNIDSLKEGLGIGGKKPPDPPSTISNFPQTK